VTRATPTRDETIGAVHMGDQINSCCACSTIDARLGARPSVEELAKALDVPPKKVEK